MVPLSSNRLTLYPLYSSSCNTLFSPLVDTFSLFFSYLTSIPFSYLCFGPFRSLLVYSHLLFSCFFFKPYALPSPFLIFYTCFYCLLLFYLFLHLIWYPFNSAFQFLGNPLTPNNVVIVTRSNRVYSLTYLFDTPSAKWLLFLLYNTGLFTFFGSNFIYILIYLGNLLLVPYNVSFFSSVVQLFPALRALVLNTTIFYTFYNKHSFLFILLEQGIPQLNY